MGITRSQFLIPDILQQKHILWVGTHWKCLDETNPQVVKASKQPEKNRNLLRVSNSLDQNQARHLSGLILVQTVCRGYQQSALVSKELIADIMPDSNPVTIPASVNCVIVINSLSALTYRFI